MIAILMTIEIVFTLIMGLYFFNALKGQQTNKIVIDKSSKKEMDNLNKMKKINLSIPLSEKSRPNKFEEIIGQEKGIKALQAAICGPNPQHVIIYGPPGVGKTAAARLVLEYAKKCSYSPFSGEAKFIEIDATTVRFDDRGIADPLIGSVHDPIYQGAGALGVAGIPQPKPGAVTKAHGGILFIDEIGELHPIELNKLLKVLEDRKVFFDSSYYNSMNGNMPEYIREVFENGLPADFRLIGATTRRPDEINPAIRSRCVEIFFRSLKENEIELIAKNAVEKINISIDDEAIKLIGKYASNGRETVNMVQLGAGIVLNEKNTTITSKEIEWIVENGQYLPHIEPRINDVPRVGYVNGLGVYGINSGALMEIEATAIEVGDGNGRVKATGIVEEEEMNVSNRKIKKMSTARCSVENALTMLEKVFGIDVNNYDIHVNFAGGVPVDGPSAGISISCAIYSAIKNASVDNKVAMTGEITLYGDVKPVGGINSKVSAAEKAGVTTVLIPASNYQNILKTYKNMRIIPVKNIKEVFKYALVENKNVENFIGNEQGILTAKGINKDNYMI
ncbi:Lon protease [Clostridium sp. DMHC 10]|uniref:ATP-dependent protease LonB n=1 Tax=Clostridium sp. DMHC 10 TaxID=747377 RepID=UPI00069D5D99|nr:ATP-dependent protease LonB [Clostridium sp. DMHC 10]KOF56104.1 Lon protease [Clostridium sp. DMHC 10]